jgi:hypothetical protein
MSSSKIGEIFAILLATLVGGILSAHKWGQWNMVGLIASSTILCCALILFLGRFLDRKNRRKTAGLIEAADEARYERERNQLEGCSLCLKLTPRKSLWRREDMVMRGLCSKCYEGHFQIRPALDKSVIQLYPPWKQL